MAKNAIWKYTLSISAPVGIMIPDKAHVLHVGVQEILQAGGATRLTPTMWVLLDREARLHPHEVKAYGTGWDCPEPPDSYIGTVDIGGFVWHYFMRKMTQ